MVLGHVFQVECWEEHPSVGAHLVYYGQGKLAKEMKKGLERKKTLIGILFMKIMEIWRKGR